MRLLFIITCLSVVTTAYAQQLRISGNLKTPEGQVVSYASVLLKNMDHRIIAYATSDAKGSFTLILSDTVSIKNKFIEVNHLGYKKNNTALIANKSHYELIMEEKQIDLSEVEIRSRPKIRSSNDTLSYDVESFAKPEDRTIGDVLKRMPGIEVEENGQIKYNGKDISNFYMDGDDLLNDRYATGTKTIPHDMVKDIEVLQNHQPIEVLRGKSISDQVALNLTIKEEAKLKLSGQAKIGGGIPDLYDVELNTMLFNKKHKSLNVVKGNNIGVDLATELTSFNAVNRMRSMDNTKPDELLYAGTVKPPDLPKERYYFNHSGSLNANHLVNLKNGLQLKSNIGLLFDKNTISYASWNDLYLSNDTIRYNETQKITNRPFLADFSFDLKANKEHYYFNNRLKIGFSGETGQSSLMSNTLDINQQLKTLRRDFSNTLSYIPALPNKNILNINWYINHYDQPQALAIRPGIHEAVLNDSIPFQAIDQSTSIPTWFSHLSIGYHLPKGLIKQNYSIGLLNEWQQLNSQLRLLQQGGEETSYGEDNHLRWNRHRLLFKPLYEYKSDRWESVLALPISLQRIAYTDYRFSLDEVYERALFNPNWNIRYLTNMEDYLSFNYEYSNQLGNINGIYRGAILTNYRSLQENNATLQAIDAHNVGLNYHFQRSISMFFMYAGVHYSRARANTINSLVVTNNLSSVEQLPFANSTNSLSMNAGISKYLFTLHANVGTRFSWSNTQYNQFLNDELLPFNTISFTLNPYLEARLWNLISLRYDGKGTWTTSRLLTENFGTALPDRQVQLLDQSVGLTYVPFKNTFMKMSGRHIHAKQMPLTNVNYFFTDLSLRHKINKWNADIQLDINNLADIRSFEMYTLSANQLAYNHYQLRGRMFELKIAVNL